MSLSVNPDIRLFDDGTDPDDVRKGEFADSWLLSALSMISAATVGDGGVDEQVLYLPDRLRGGLGGGRTNRETIEFYMGGRGGKLSKGMTYPRLGSRGELG